MAELILLGAAIFAIFGIPILTGLFGKAMGRRFWLWFLMGCLLPLISTAILFWLPDISEEKAKSQI